MAGWSRRGFLGALASLPLVAKFGQVEESQLQNVAPNVTPEMVESVMNEPLDSNAFRYMLCGGSGCMPRCSG